MHENLKAFMLRLATDPELLNRFIADPAATAEEEGLDETEREILFSGNQTRIYFAIGGKPSPPPQPHPPQQRQQQQQQPVAQPPQLAYQQYAQPVAYRGWAWTPWGWYWYGG